MERYYEEYPNPFSGIFGGNYVIPQYRQNGTEEKRVGGGSGFFVSADGYIVTNAHVVADEEAKYTVFLNDGNKYDAEVVAKDDVLDIAVIKVDGEKFSYLSFGDSEAVKPGQSVIAIGNALGEFNNTVSVGVVSGLSRSIVASDGQGESESLVNILQTDAAINPGNSGGPLLDLSGHVIGVNVAASIGSAENIGFALPANSVKTTVDSIRDNGRLVKPYLGVRYLNISSGLQTEEDLSVDSGALIVTGDQENEPAIVPNSPAAKAGLKEHDIITEVDGKKITPTWPLNIALREHQVGDKVDLKVLRDDKELTVTVTLEEAPEV
jgi:serine protease Do